MYVCHCRAVTDRQVRETIAAGVCDLYELAGRSGAGITCGGCLPAVRKLLNDLGHPCEQACSLRALRERLGQVATSPSAAIPA